MTYDFIIVGAGIVGLSTAYKLSESFPELDILVLEKEEEVAAHQTGNNSGVIHSGIYYKPNSYRAKNCVEGRHQLVDFCEKNGVDYEICGKVIVATDEEDIPRLNGIFETGKINGIEGIKKIGPEELKEIEPYADGVKAIHVPCSGIVDYIGVCKQLRELIEDKGHTVACGKEVKKINNSGDDLAVVTNDGTFNSRYLINCAGLYSDHVAESAGVFPDIQIVPFRGEYFELKPEVKHFVNGLIYPMPNPAFPFLGVHFTKMVTGAVECGPNAVFAFKREGYDKISFDLEETIETLNFPGFWNLAKEHWKMGLDEWYRSFSKRAFVKGLQKLIPAIKPQHLKSSPSGVRAMALKPNGEILDDFHYEATENEIHVLNAPSPAATAGLAIGDEIVKRAESSFSL
ncbi:L-2-hydroxyglutarate oxidase [Fodinibius halophilus]|uniref:L-2-hydroxyglutarate oxidase n=1 Tax=Fodinibius halophilus TaxID=1736908 RepID=A0A6M1TFL9_9BACT|nr:L-2-hydroxyglutarate oxidase [Fodinibius halophilus]NGP89574.1 L-2-hydroxyglutarate oxidase [Fodinibius halophilus]